MLRPAAVILALCVSGLAARADDPAGHWAFKPPVKSAVPRVRDPGTSRNFVDRFIQRGLDDAAIEPSEQADKPTLIRRATFDLLGLPPTHEEVAAFLADPAPDAYERLIDRLLASPRHGERWARYWLDLARYADTKGYVYGGREEPKFVHAHVYRDWVVESLNRDLPYDQFLILQLAADRVPEGQPRSLAAMGFLTIGKRYLGVIPDILDDRIDVLTRATQGLTVSCARCHDHKFDPIPTADYYSLYGVLGASTEKIVPIDANPERTDAYTAFEKELDARKTKLQERFVAKRDELNARLRARSGDYLAMVPDAQKLPTDDFYEIRQPNDLIPTVARHWQSYLYRRDGAFDPIFEPWHELSRAQPGAFPEILARLLSDTANPLNPLVAQAFTGVTPASMKEVATIYGKLLTESDQAAPHTDPAREELRLVLYGPGSPTQLPPGSINEVEWYFDEPTRVELSTLSADIERLILSSPGAPPHAVIFQDKAELKNPRVFLRGNPATPGGEVPRRYLNLIEGVGRQPYTASSGRLELARSIASRDNPLTARVIVNRIWMHHFGEGLVSTPSDFGTRASTPSHPELLDHLAVWFMEEGWSIKKLHRLLMLSATYRQSSADRSDCFAVDPGNRLLWRAHPRRLDFESMRDAIIAVTGELDATMGGQAGNLFVEATGSTQTIWGKVDRPALSTRQRRTIYGFIDRQFLPGVYRVFDFANPDLHAPRRPVTTVPQQALFLINSPFMTHRARALASRPDVASLADPAARITQLYKTVFQHDPTPRQVEAAARFIAAIKSDPAPPPPTLSIDDTQWRYGVGEFDPATSRMKSFDGLPYFTGTAWQGGPSYPDLNFGWAQLTSTGGHAGNDPAHAAVRRWTAPGDATLSITGTLKHEEAPGDGVRARIVSSRHGLLAQWELHNQSAETVLHAIEVKAGDTLDFVIDIRGELNNDMFTWAPVIEATGGEAQRWSAEQEFAGPGSPPSLTAWEQYAQVLLLSNEFMFID